MQLYDCKVRLNGEVHNEVRKKNQTAAHITCLRYIHGPDSVLEVEPNGSTKGDHEKIRANLESEFGAGLRRIEMSIFSLFGPEHQPLPLKLPKSMTNAEPAPRRRKAQAEPESAEALFA